MHWPQKPVILFALFQQSSQVNSRPHYYDYPKAIQKTLETKKSNSGKVNIFNCFMLQLELLILKNGDHFDEKL